MKHLRDQNLPRSLIERVPTSLSESKHVLDVGLDTSPDQAIRAFAGDNGYTILSKDGDFSRFTGIRVESPLGRSGAQVILDQAQSDPGAAGAVIVHNRNGTTWIGRGSSQEFVRTTLSGLLREQRLVLTITARQDSAYDWSWAGERSVVERFEHTGLDWDVVAELANRLSSNREIVRIDRDLFRRCDQDNVASAATAKRLGFRNRREYRFIVVPKIE